MGAFQTEVWPDLSPAPAQPAGTLLMCGTRYRLLKCGLRTDVKTKDGLR